MNKEGFSEAKKRVQDEISEAGKKLNFSRSKSLPNYAQAREAVSSSIEFFQNLAHKIQENKKQ